ncbi:MAG: ArdC-like ssDNA-binding domain-containing protein [Acidimicrobiia bacterium]|nr:ArdC-like ssDNA-binding domain-containing protein [Acidimicrobiia bacterium]
MANKVYEIITGKILEELDKGVIPWRKPWKAASGSHTNIVSGKPYNGVNIILLGIAAFRGGFSSNYWMTFKQAKQKGGSVRKGETGTQVIFWKVVDKKVEDEDTGEIEIKKNFILRYYTVFNLDQVDGVKAPVTNEEVNDHSPIEAAEAIVDGMPNKPEINFGGSRACYVPMLDVINNPELNAFGLPEEFYSTLFHELVHSTGHKDRLDRFENNTQLAAFGSEDYSKEELVAEIGAAFLCGHAGIENQTLDNSVAYINGWREKLTNDPKLIIHAAAKAQKAADFILNAA